MDTAKVTSPFFYRMCFCRRKGRKESFRREAERHGRKKIGKTGYERQEADSGEAEGVRKHFRQRKKK